MSVGISARSTRTSHIFASIATVVVSWLSVSADRAAAQSYTITTATGRGADATIRGMESSDQSNVNEGAAANLFARWYTDASGPRYEKFYLRFDLAGVPRPITTARLDLFWDRDGDVEAPYDVYGLAEAPSYGTNTRTGQLRLGEDWPESQLTWNNAPGNVPSLTDNNFQSAQYLFTLTSPGALQNVSGSLGVGGQRLLEFLNADTNNLVTLMVRKPVNQAYVGTFASKESTEAFAQAPRLEVAVGPALIPAGDQWRYRDDGANLGVAWRARDFVETGWKTGAAELGYGETDQSTTVKCSNAANCTTANFATTYFRRTFDLAEFDIDDPEAVTELRATLLRDDAAAVYLNGTQIFRDANLPPGAAFNTFATAISDENEITPFNIDPTLLVPGLNTIAIEVHQASATSSDVSFDFSLTATVAVPEPSGMALALFATATLVAVRFKQSSR